MFVHALTFQSFWISPGTSCYADVTSQLAALELYVREMDRSILWALERLGCASVTLKDEQTACVKAIYERKEYFSGCLQVLASQCAM